MSEQEVYIILKQILTGLSHFINKYNMQYRDINFSNILIFKNGKYALTNLDIEDYRIAFKRNLSDSFV
jgi:serine/threonine protein kinase